MDASRWTVQRGKRVWNRSKGGWRVRGWRDGTRPARLAITIHYFVGANWHNWLVFGTHATLKGPYRPSRRELMQLPTSALRATYTSDIHHDVEHAELNREYKAYFSWIRAVSNIEDRVQQLEFCACDLPFRPGRYVPCFPLFFYLFILQRANFILHVDPSFKIILYF